MSASFGEVRRSQVVTTYGPGSLIPIDEHSYMVAGLDNWDASDMSLEIHEPRLERYLGVEGFRLPPSSDGDQRGARDIPVIKFPRIHICSKCERLGRYRDVAGVGGACSTCSSRLVTSRFIVVCESGHVSDFPYHRWVHRGTNVPEGLEHQLSLKAEGRSASLDDIKVNCSCGAMRAMRGALGKNAMAGVVLCFGDQPWLRGSDPVACEHLPRAVQRGASNVWQPLTESAISIPPWSDEASRYVDRYWNALLVMPRDILDTAVRAMLREQVGIHADEVLAVISERQRLMDGPSPTPTGLREQEHSALQRGRLDEGRKQQFVCILPDPAEVIPAPVADLRLVTRLREIRALTGFYRLQRPRAGESGAPLSRKPLRWLPAIEVSGEGVFVGLDLEAVRRWEDLSAVRARIARLGGSNDPDGQPLPPERVPTPRRVLVHTLAHALIDQWSLDCGYPSASLRERLYVGEEMAGFLVYTATSDSAGSLGGVVGMAKEGRFARSLAEAIARAAWCSNDPLCVESGAVGVDARNLGACHACVLLPETSCEIGNTLLDRGVLIGADDGCPGFFEGLLA